MVDQCLPSSNTSKTLTISFSHLQTWTIRKRQVSNGGFEEYGLRDTMRILTWNCWYINTLTILTSDFCLRRKILDRVQSSINEANHLEPKMLGIMEGPQISLWTNSKGIGTLSLLIRKKTRWCSQTSRYKFSTSIPLNDKGNIFLRMPNDGCPRRDDEAKSYLLLWMGFQKGMIRVPDFQSYFWLNNNLS